MTNADIVEFYDEKYQEILMKIFLRNNRKVLLYLIPYLKEIVEREYWDTMRGLAAYTLGKMGELDIESIILPFLYQWASSEKPFLRASVGYLFEGVLHSNNKNYRKHSLAVLKNMALQYPVNSNIHGAAIYAYRQIGIHNLTFALKELRIILEKTIKGVFEAQAEMEDWVDTFHTQGDIFDEEYVLINLRF
jgi:hypothetical protein